MDKFIPVFKMLIPLTDNNYLLKYYGELHALLF
nr:MAG TPA: hypothetical protein [Caudoviricetes sp.]